jgi:hypothetical protein
MSKAGFVGRFRELWSDLKYAMNVQDKTYYRLVAKRKVAEANLELVCGIQFSQDHFLLTLCPSQRKKEAAEVIRNAQEMRLKVLQKVEDLKRMKVELESKVSGLCKVSACLRIILP